MERSWNLPEKILTYIYVYDIKYSEQHPNSVEAKMKNLRNQNGFTLIELLIVLVIVCILAVLALLIPMNNLYWTEAGVLKQLKHEHPSTTAITATERNVIRYSRITVEEGGKEKTYLLDTNILFNYIFHEE